MTFAYPLLNEPLLFAENSVQVLVIENQPELRRFISVLRQQLQGLADELVLAEGDNILELSKTALFISEPFSLDFDSKKLESKMFRDACEAGADFSEELCELSTRLNSLAAKIRSSLDYDAISEPIDNWEGLIKLMGFHVDEEELSFSEGLLEYMALHRRFFNKSLFVFYNLKALMSPEEMALFYRNALYKKFSILMLEDHQRYCLGEYEKTVIVDKDLCVF